MYACMNRICKKISIQTIMTSFLQFNLIEIEEDDLFNIHVIICNRSASALNWKNSAKTIV